MWTISLCQKLWTKINNRSDFQCHDNEGWNKSSINIFLAQMEPHIKVEIVLCSLQDGYNVHLRCICSVGMWRAQYMWPQSKTNDSYLFVWETFIAFSSCLTVCDSWMWINVWTIKDFEIQSWISRQTASMFACLHVIACICMYANVCVHVCTYSRLVWVCAGLVALVVCRSHWGARRQVSSDQEAVMGDWSGGDGGSRFH